MTSSKETERLAFCSGHPQCGEAALLVLCSPSLCAAGGLATFHSLPPKFLLPVAQAHGSHFQGGGQGGWVSSFLSALIQPSPSSFFSLPPHLCHGKLHFQRTLKNSYFFGIFKQVISLSVHQEQQLALCSCSRDTSVSSTVPNHCLSKLFLS